MKIREVENCEQQQHRTSAESETRREGRDGGVGSRIGGGSSSSTECSEPIHLVATQELEHSES